MMFKCALNISVELWCLNLTYVNSCQAEYVKDLEIFTQTDSVHTLIAILTCNIFQTRFHFL